NSIMRAGSRRACAGHRIRKQTGTATERKRMATETKAIFKPDGKNAIHDGIEHEPGGGKALLDPTDTVMFLLNHRRRPFSAHLSIGKIQMLRKRIRQPWSCKRSGPGSPNLLFIAPPVTLSNSPLSMMVTPLSTTVTWPFSLTLPFSSTRGAWNVMS